MEKIQTEVGTNPERFIGNYISGQIQIGYLYLEKKDISKSIKAFKNALKSLNQLLSKFPNDIQLLQSKSRLQYNIGSNYALLGKFRKGRNVLISELKQIKVRYNEDPKSNIHDLVAFYDALGDLFFQSDNLGLSRVYYQQALSYAKLINQEEDQSNTRTLLNLNFKLANIERLKDNTNKAFYFCNEAINQLEILKMNPTDTIEIRLSVNILWIKLQIQSGDYESAMHNTLDTIEYFKTLSMENKQNHLIAFAKICQEIGDYFMISRLSDNCLTFYKQACQFYQESPFYNQESMIEHSSILNNMAAVFMETKEFEKVEKLLFRSLGLRRQLFNEDPEEHVLDYAGTLVNLATFYADINLEQETPRKLINESLSLLTKYDPEIYDTDESKYSEVMTRALMTLEALDSRN